MLFDPGHDCLHESGFDYHFRDGPEYLHDMDGRRATLAQFQTFPGNTVEGMGTLVNGGVGFIPGSAWSLFQPAQVIQNQMSILSDMLGGGMDAGALALQPLLDPQN